MLYIHPSTHRTQTGFTLVELAIVMIIIGLLLGGILKGQAMIQSARISGAVQEINAFRTAYLTFQSLYGAKPGDIRDAQTRIQNCNAASNCLNGNGNNIVSGSIADPLDSNFFWLGWGSSTAYENTQFWKHMALADLIVGVNPTASDANLEWKQSHPVSRINGGYTVLNSRCSGPGCTASPQGFVLRLHRCLTCPNIEENLGSAALTSSELWRIDMKLDDDSPQTGIVRGFARGNGAASSHCEISYAANASRDCVLAYVLEN